MRDYAGAAACDLERHAAFCRAMLERGVYLPPSQFEAWFPSLAHGERARGAHARGRARGARRAVSVLAEVVRAAGPALAAGARPGAGPARFGGELGEPALRARGGLRGLPAALRRRAAFAGMDDDLRLLAGDALYALGLARLAERGDLAAVAELSDLISLSAQAHAEGRGERAEALWDARVRAARARARAR